LYEYVKDVVERRGPYREEHLSKIRAGRESGRIVMAGPLGDERPTGAAIVFADDAARAEVEAFVNDDPYVKAGLVASWRIEPWKLV
jgi:uncharacterized protein YciI